jgi:hypothetical protein
MLVDVVDRVMEIGRGKKRQTSELLDPHPEVSVRTAGIGIWWSPRMAGTSASNYSDQVASMDGEA